MESRYLRTRALPTADGYSTMRPIRGKRAVYAPHVSWRRDIEVVQPGARGRRGLDEILLQTHLLDQSRHFILRRPPVCLLVLRFMRDSRRGSQRGSRGCSVPATDESKDPAAVRNAPLRATSAGAGAYLAASLLRPASGSGGENETCGA